MHHLPHVSMAGSAPAAPERSERTSDARRDSNGQDFSSVMKSKARRDGDGPSRTDQESRSRSADSTPQRAGDDRASRAKDADSAEKGRDTSRSDNVGNRTDGPPAESPETAMDGPPSAGDGTDGGAQEVDEVTVNDLDTLSDDHETDFEIDETMEGAMARHEVGSEDTEMAAQNPAFGAPAEGEPAQNGDGEQRALNADQALNMAQAPVRAKSIGEAQAAPKAAKKAGSGLNPIEAVLRKTMESGWAAKGVKGESTHAALSPPSVAAQSARSTEAAMAGTATSQAAQGGHPTIPSQGRLATDWISPRARHMGNWVKSERAESVPMGQTAGAEASKMVPGTAVAGQATGIKNQPLMSAQPMMADPRAEASRFAPLEGGEAEARRGQADFGAALASHELRAPGEAANLRVTQIASTTVPRQIGGAMAAAMATKPGGEIEIQLHPEELGKLRMRMAIGDGAITVTLAAERSETTDMMRRNIAILSEELAKQGFTDVSFSFEQQSSGDEGQGQEGKSFGSGGKDGGSSLDDEFGPAGPVVHRVAMLADGGLDVRL